jgi:hypothetical protein
MPSLLPLGEEIQGVGLEKPPLQLAITHFPTTVHPEPDEGRSGVE